jgi:catechol 2,3-dioxygenase-like lactoylglutathione lyase family enzyme
MTPPTLSGLHHVTIPVNDLDGAMTWFETVFGARRHTELDHHDEHGTRFAVVLSLPGVAPLVALRHARDVTEAVSQWALGVADQAELARWATHFDGHGVAHSDVMPAQAGHVMTCTTPGGPAVLLYADRGDDAAAGRATS